MCPPLVVFRGQEARRKRARCPDLAWSWGGRCDAKSLDAGPLTVGGASVDERERHTDSCSVVCLCPRLQLSVAPPLPTIFPG
jgi:hypothetical protein